MEVKKKVFVKQKNNYEWSELAVIGAIIRIIGTDKKRCLSVKEILEKLKKNIGVDISEQELTDILVSKMFKEMGILFHKVETKNLEEYGFVWNGLLASNYQKI